jgi:hypothetical protein
MRHALRIGNGSNDAGKDVRLDRCRWNAILDFDIDAMLGDRRRTSASMADPDNYGVAALLDLAK